VTPSGAAAPGVLGRFVKAELHSLLGAAGAAYGLNAHTTTVLVAGAAYAFGMKALGLLASVLEKKAAGNPAEEAAVTYVADAATRFAAEHAPAAPPTAGMQAGAP
jgi:hypothetical protein